MGRPYQIVDFNAIRTWPAEWVAAKPNASIFPRLVHTHDKFLNILALADSYPSAWKTVLSGMIDLHASLFLKHMSVLTDVSGDDLQRIRAGLEDIFPDNRLIFRWKDKTTLYDFQTFDSIPEWTPAVLGIDGQGVHKSLPIRAVQEDAVMLLMYGGLSIQPCVPAEIVEKCVIGSLLGKRKELDAFVRQRYLWVSRHAAADKAEPWRPLPLELVREHLQAALPKWDFSLRNIPSLRQKPGGPDVNFDIVAKSPSRGYCAIEVSFLTTPNQMIERKAALAVARREALKAAGHAIVYVIDGAGNMDCEAAVRALNDNGDFIVTFKPVELDKLVAFLRDFEEQRVAAKKKQRAAGKR